MCSNNKTNEDKIPPLHGKPVQFPSENTYVLKNPSASGPLI